MTISIPTMLSTEGMMSSRNSVQRSRRIVQRIRPGRSTCAVKRALPARRQGRICAVADYWVQGRV